MNTIAKWVVERPWLGWCMVLACALLAGWLTGNLNRQQREAERFSLLQTEAEQRGIELMSQTLDGNIMGALSLLGTIDQEVKREARGDVTGKGKGERIVEGKGKSIAVSDTNIATMESISRTFDTEGAFLVTEAGLIGSAWYSNGKPSFGSSVKFRPYYQMAMQGIENIYAAVGTGQGERMLYFSSPVYAENTNATNVVGAVVARVGLLKVDNLLRDKADIALLLSPQAVVFASSKPAWLAHAAGQMTDDRLQAIREVKQFGNLFDNKVPVPLPIDITPGIQHHEDKAFAVARAKVRWNDPLGDWTLVLIEDLSRTAPLSGNILRGGLAGFVILVLGGLLLRMLRSHHLQVTAMQALDRHARDQQAGADRKAAIAAAALRLQQSQTLAELAQAYLAEIHALIGALQGTVYVVTPAGELRLAGSYACAVPPAPTLALGDGLLGQAAAERRLLRLDAPAEAGMWRIRSGLGNSAPRCLLMAPVLLNDTLVGAVELALMAATDSTTEETLTEMNKLLALDIEVLQRSESAGVAAHFQQTLMDTIPYPVFYKGADTRFLGVNRAYEETFAIRRADLIGKRVLDLEYLPEADRRAYQTEDESTLASGGQVQREMAIPFADGRLHDTLYYVSTFRTPEGSPGGLVGTFIDISAQKSAQESLNHLAEVERFSEVLQDDGLRLVKLNWHPSYESGNAEIDRDHRTLFVLANDLLNAILAGHNRDEIGQIVDALASETTAHFAREEALQRALGYAEVDAHAEHHRALLDKAGTLIAEFKAGNLAAGPFFQFLAFDVVARHMLREDRKFFPLIARAASRPLQESGTPS